MPLIALERESGHRVDVTMYKDPRLELKAGDYLCPLCETRMFLKAGKIIAPHFAHQSACDSVYAAHPESFEHLMAKQVMAQYLRTEYAKIRGAVVELEVRVPEAGRVADIMVTYPTGWRIAHEMQLASITTGDLDERTASYARAGIDTYWWLGKSANTQTNRDWCLATLGVCGVIGFRTVEGKVDILRVNTN